MGIFRTRAIVAPLTLSERYNSASAMHGSAVSVFQDIAARISEAETEYRSVAAEADEEINRLTYLRDTAHNDAQRARESAVSILDLTRGYRNE